MHKLFWGLLLLLGTVGAQDVRACGGAPGLPAWVSGRAVLGVYQGTLGRQDIVLRVRPKSNDEDEGSGYFYRRRGVTLALTPFHRGQHLIWQESVWDNQQGRTVVTGCFDLTRTARGLRGSWHAPGRAAKLAVNLQPIAPATLKLALPPSPDLLRLRRADPYRFLAVNHAWPKVRGGVREPLTSLTYPRVSGGRAAENALLQDRQLGHVLNALECRSRVQTPDETTSTLSASVTWQSPRLLGLREDMSEYCGGAHPDTLTILKLYDRRTLRPVSVTALWPKLNQTRLKALLTQALSDPECRDVLRDDDTAISAGLSRQGLMLSVPYLPHVVSVCGEPVTLLFTRLKAEANTQSPYFHELYP